MQTLSLADLRPPHRQKGRRSNIDGRTTRHPGYGISLTCRWLVEKASNQQTIDCTSTNGYK